MIAMNDGDLAEFCGQIVDGVEDYLEECKNVTPSMLKNKDRDTESDDDNSAIIYGEDYDTIADVARAQCEKLLTEHIKVNDEPLDDIMKQVRIAGIIYATGMWPVLAKISGLQWNQFDTLYMNAYITNTFLRWGLFK